MKENTMTNQININEADANLSQLYHSIKDIKNDFRNANLYKLIVDQLKGETLLDVGSGVGHFVSIANENGFKAEGIEPSKKLTTLGKELYKNNTITCMRAEEFETDRLYDNISMLDVVEHIENDVELLNHYKKFLKPDGQFVIIVPAHQILYGKRDISVGHYRRYSRKQVEALLEACNLTPISLRHWNALGFLPYFISEKILKTPLNPKIRNNAEQKGIKQMVSKMLFAWVKHIENNFDFRFGLSLICIAKKNY